jgi:hypothetical protein
VRLSGDNFITQHAVQFFIRHKRVDSEDFMNFTKRLALAGITAAAALVCSNTYAGDCPAGEIADCDGSGECWIETWIGDGFCDGTAQQFGADLCCYDGGTAGAFDGGDCTEADCTVQVCGDGVCGTGETPASCPADCNAAECSTVTATAGDEDGNGCTADGTSGLITLTWDGGCLAQTVEFVGLGVIEGPFPSGVTIIGIGTAGDCYEIIVTFDDGTIADAIESACHNCTLAGACCTDTGCTILLPEDCEAAGGTYVGGDCDSFPCGSDYKSCGDPAAGDCFVGNGTAGCDNTVCCATVCEVDDACCISEWDATCADFASEFCNANQGDCAADEVEDCDGTGECWPAAWVGDAYCDGTAQDFGADLCCIDNDGGDCTEEQCEVQVCGDGVCGPGETPVTCPADCDASECVTVTATALDEDGNGCSADGTSGLIELTWEGGCVAEIIEFVGLGTLPAGAYNSGVTITGIGNSSECYDINVTFVDGTVANTVVNACHTCGDPAVCGDGVCAVGETFATCPEDCDEGGCPTGQVVDCDGSGECWTEAWIGDGFCDGTAQNYNANLCCYDGGTAGAFDGGDCTAEECDGPTDPTGACCVDTTCSISTEADCSGEWQGADTACDTDTCGSDCPGDFNDDGSIGGGDLTILLAAWGTDSPDLDLNNDGIIGGGDLTILLAAWGQQCP